jgi:hypothetical protein
MKDAGVKGTGRQVTAFQDWGGFRHFGRVQYPGYQQYRSRQTAPTGATCAWLVSAIKHIALAQQMLHTC